jgi:SAM-dependent methyltransferase
MESPEFYDRAAPYYDADYEAAGHGEDVGFYVEEARAAGGPVVEMGCGTGRVLLPVARSGVEIVGVDSSAEMLARLERRLAAEPEEVRRRVRVVRGDLCTVRVPGELALVTAPFRVIQHLVERADQRAWLTNVARHLRRDPPGLLVFDSFQPDYAQIAESPTVSVDIERTDPETGRTLRRVSRSLHHPERQTFEVGFEWLVEGDDGRDVTVTEVETVARWFTRGELECLLELAGFEVLDFWGDFDRTPFGPDSEDQVVRARLRRR